MSSSPPVWDKLLILDLDDTLIHALGPDHPTLAWVPQRRVARYRVYVRPGAHAFLAWALDRFAGVAIWTSASSAYAELMLRDVVDPDRLAFVWSREHCVSTTPAEGQHVWHKDIAQLVESGWSRAQILIVDDKPEGLAGGEANLIVMPRFEGNPDDRMLTRLRSYLESIGPLADVQCVDKREWSSTLTIPTEFDVDMLDG